MTLGEMIKEYGEKNSISQFVRDSGLSKAYTYMLIANKSSTSGEPISPSIETIKKAATGMHVPFDEVFNRLDDDLVIHLSKGTAPRIKSVLPLEIADVYKQLTEESKEKVHQLIQKEYEKNKALITEYQRVMGLRKITNIEDAKVILDNAAAFGGQVGDEELIELANIVRNNHNN